MKWWEGQSYTTDAVHEVEWTIGDTKQIDMVNITSFSFYSIRPVIALKLNTMSSQNSSIILYKIDTHSYGNLVPHNILKVYFIECLRKG